MEFPGLPRAGRRSALAPTRSDYQLFGSAIGRLRITNARNQAPERLKGPVSLFDGPGNGA